MYVGSPSPDWVRHAGMNCMEGFGARDYLFADGSEGELQGNALTISDCIAACPQPNCTGARLIIC